MKTVWRKFAATLATIAVMAAIGCHGSGDPVRDCLDRLAGSARDRDADALFARVTSDFQAGDGSSRSDTQALVRRLFAAYERLDVSLSRVEIERSEGVVRARFRAELSGQPLKIGGLDALLPHSSSYDFDVRLVPEDGTWKVSWASWRQADR